MNFEVEQKFCLAGLSVEEALAGLGVQFATAVEQVDRYFNHPSRDFAVSDEALRIRSVALSSFITYKGPKIDPHTKTRREIELALADGPRAAEQLAEILMALGFRPSGIVAKSRRKGVLSWKGHQVEVALDDVQGLGPYLEMEITADEAGLRAAQAAVKSLAEQLGLDLLERRGYLEMLLEKQSQITTPQ